MTTDINEFLFITALELAGNAAMQTLDFAMSSLAGTGKRRFEENYKSTILFLHLSQILL